MKRFEFLYGVHPVIAALERRGADVLELYVAKNRDNGGLDRLLAAADVYGLTPQEAKSETLVQMAHSTQHQGVVAKCRRMPVRDEKWLEEQLCLVDNPLVVVLEGVTDPHNLGAVMRTADASGVTAVVVPRKNSVHLTTAVHKVSVGASQVIPLVVVSDLPDFVRQLGANLQVVGMSSEEKAESFYSVRLDLATALVLGSEGRGLSRRTKAACNVLAALPMAGYVDSLNVSVAAGVSLFEVVRQRLA